MIDERVLFDDLANGDSKSRADGEDSLDEEVGCSDGYFAAAVIIINPNEYTLEGPGRSIDSSTDETQQESDQMVGRSSKREELFQSIVDGTSEINQGYIKA